MRLLLLARHGQSLFNVDGIVNGDPVRDRGLSPRGVAEAEGLAAQIATVRIDLCVTSRFPRAQETARLALGGREVPTVVDGDLDDIRLEMETHFFGTLRMVRAFAPILGANGGGAVVNLLSVLSWITFLHATSYAAAKAAEWSLTNGIRLELAAQGTQVSGVHLGAADTDMMARWDVPKIDPAAVATAVADGVARGDLEILVDDAATGAKQALAADLRTVYPQLP